MSGVQVHIGGRWEEARGNRMNEIAAGGIVVLPGPMHNAGNI